MQNRRSGNDQTALRCGHHVHCYRSARKVLWMFNRRLLIITLHCKVDHRNSHGPYSATMAQCGACGFVLTAHTSLCNPFAVPAAAGLAVHDPAHASLPNRQQFSLNSRLCGRHLRRRLDTKGNLRAKMQLQLGATDHQHVPSEIADQTRNQTQRPSTYRSRCNTKALVRSRSSLYLQARSGSHSASSTSADTNAPARPRQSPPRLVAHPSSVRLNILGELLGNRIVVSAPPASRLMIRGQRTPPQERLRLAAT